LTSMSRFLKKSLLNFNGLGFFAEENDAA